MSILSDTPQNSQVNNWQDLKFDTIKGLHMLDLEVDRRKYGVNIPHINHYSTDLNAAFTLLQDCSWEMRSIGPGLITCTLWVGGYMVAHQSGYTPALAICKAWLAWHDANGGQES